MSDLKERFPNSVELHEPTPEQLELEADRKRAAETPTAREAFMTAHPEFSALQREPVTGVNKMGVLEKVKAFRVANLAAELSSKPNDLDESERSFVAEVLALRVAGAGGSVRRLIDDLHIDSAQDFAMALTDAAEVRRMRAKHTALLSRYKSMPDFHLTPESFVVRGQ